MIKAVALACAFVISTATFVSAQTDINLGGLTVDNTAPLEVTADTLSIDQDTGSAVFSGNVLVIQGELRMTAGSVEVIYGEDQSEISRLVAEGGVTFVTATEAAEAQEATYDMTTGLLTLAGEVLLTQGASAISAARMVINVSDGTATMEGRVRTVLQQGGN